LPVISGAPVAEPAAQVANSGFELAWVVMALMILGLLYVLAGAVQLNRGGRWPLLSARSSDLIPVLSVLGLGVALYLTYVETQQVAAVCGPVGDCNAVQASPYAELFGVLPVGLLGAGGYVAVIVAWAAGRFAPPDSAIAGLAPMLLLAMALFGVLFSIYLTYIELFVILAVCIWCLTSAVLMTIIMVLGLRPALAVDDASDEGMIGPGEA
jgi:uncharacterized membrane protein